jgi:hypothetical protein
LVGQGENFSLSSVLAFSLPAISLAQARKTWKIFSVVIHSNRQQELCLLIPAKKIFKFMPLYDKYENYFLIM